MELNVFNTTIYYQILKKCIEKDEFIIYESLSKYVKIPVICMYISNDNDFIQNK